MQQVVSLPAHCCSDTRDVNTILKLTMKNMTQMGYSIRKTESISKKLENANR